jgi:SAM-dependent methyltransferase
MNGPAGAFAAPAGSGAATVACALCGSMAQTPVYPLNRSAIVRCGSCGFHFVSPRMDESGLEAKLQEWAQADVLDAERLRIAFDAVTMALYDSYLRRMEAQLGGRTGRLLDVGCSTGAFLVAARQRGWQVEGLELGMASAAYAQDTLGLTIHRASLFDHEAPESSYDAIVFLEVIEHLPDPAAALARIARWLKPGGVLLASTPNYDSLYRRLFGTRWWVVNCEDEHIMFFNEAKLAASLEAVGLSVRWRRIRGFDLSGLARECRRSLRPAPAVQATAPAPVSGVEGGDTGYHVARLRKERIKARLAAFGLLKLARLGLKGLDLLSTARWSPMHAWGEQLVMIATKASMKDRA